MESMKFDSKVTATRIETRYLIVKRLMDIIGAILGIIIFSSFFLLISIAIKLEDSKGPVFYAHYRLGENGNLIPVYKFRSMYQNADQMIKLFTEEQKKEYAENFKLKDDPRITRVGKILRKTSLDELPQFFNVLKGDMSIVGPRPIVEAELEKYKGYEDIFLSVKPGLTGMWQASGRSETTYEERVLMDIEYIQKRTIFLDIKLIFCTVISVIKGQGAY